MNVEQFLLDLTELSNKHGITIGGCECCGSPFLILRKPKHPYSVEPIGPYEGNLSDERPRINH